MTEPHTPSDIVNGVFVNNPAIRELRQGVGQLSLLRKFLFQRTPGVEPKGAIPVQPIMRADLEARREQEENHLYRLGHSSILIKFGPDYWLIDPVFCNRTSPSQWFGPKRFHQPPLAISELPKIKTVVISHNHYDHLDRAAIRVLASAVERFVVPLGVGRYLQQWGVKADQIVELNWWQSLDWAGQRPLPSIFLVAACATGTNHFGRLMCLSGQASVYFLAQTQGILTASARLATSSARLKSQ